MLQANLARPYAKALFDLAIKHNSEGVWLNSLANLDQLFTNHDFCLFLNDPNTNSTSVLKLVQEFLRDDYTPDLNNFLMLLAENNRLAVMPEIHSIFKVLVLEYQNRAEAILESAYPLSDSEQQQFATILSKKFDKKVTVKAVVNPELIAGVKITVDDKVIDSSVKGRLNNLATQLTK